MCQMFLFVHLTWPENEGEVKVFNTFVKINV